MKKSLFLLLLSAVFVFSCKSDTQTKANTIPPKPVPAAKTEVTEETVVPEKSTTLKDGAYTIDAAASTLNWSGSKPSGKKHIGTVKIKSGGVDIQNGTITQGSADIDMTTILNKDLSGMWKAKLEKHLKSPEFFDIGKFPTATITIKEATNNGFKSSLKIKGIEKPVFIPASISTQGDKVVITIKPFTIDRTNWGVKYNSGKFFQNLKDRQINDDMVLAGKIILNPKG